MQGRRTLPLQCSRQSSRLPGADAAGPQLMGRADTATVVQRAEQQAARADMPEATLVRCGLNLAPTVVQQTGSRLPGRTHNRGATLIRTDGRSHQPVQRAEQQARGGRCRGHALMPQKTGGRSHGAAGRAAGCRRTLPRPRWPRCRRTAATVVQRASRLPGPDSVGPR
jgi:hypothetical protein